LDFRFLDAASYIIIKPNNTIDTAATRERLARLPRNTSYVIGANYGQNAGGVKTYTCDIDIAELLKEAPPIRHRVHIL
jgi:hypothetical protein